ncbi:ubiquitin carboxyl-terminal hydrolase-domain-containing protein [Xylariomycetidae sp. FL2044]|nr:ubiquitin carboxyl-terminal hydrolase-domain-containing protein [Xylariomycetidae sp. FL2044]
MKATGLPKKFLSRREKNGHRRGRSSDPAHKHRPLSSEAFFSLFRPDGSKQAAKEESPLEKVKAAVPNTLIDEVRKKIAELDMPKLSDDHIRYALNAKYASNDVDKAIELLVLQQTSLTGKIISHNPEVRMLGAENRGNVTCYLDSLLFAMFSKLEAFECMLVGDIRDDAQRKLAALLRLWVNMLRSGKLIEKDMTEHIQDALAECGWKEAQQLEQQDTSEAFAFITETLQLPLLTLQVDLFHHGKNDDADHKVVYERLLNLAVPPDTENKGIKLEDCLEEYFNSQVDVLRDSLDEKKTAERLDLASALSAPSTPLTPRSTIRIVPNEDDAHCSTPEAIENSAPLERQTSAPDDSPPGMLSTPEPQTFSPQSPHAPLRPVRSRTESIIQRVVLDEDEKAPEDDTGSLFQRAKRTTSAVKAVTIPAWQFFKLIPWHSPANKEPESDLEVARHFNQRPVVGICLKRYMMDAKGVMKRQNTYIDIPDSLRLPHFIANERYVEEGGLSAEYKLVLQSVVCHRGDSLHSGHYISFCRVAPKLLTDNRRHDNDPPPDYEEPQWVKFDDLASERVSTVDDIKQSLKEEMPYLLFYQILPIVEMPTTPVEETGPPAYDEPGVNLAISETSQSQEGHGPSRQPSSYFDNASMIPSAPASIRFSSDLERPPRTSFTDEDGFLAVSRRGSVMYDSILGTSPGATSENPSPVATPAEETTAQRLTRAAAKFRGGSSRSRPQSQAGENRISLTMSRLGGLVKGTSREPLRDSTFIDPEDEFEIVNPSNGASNGGVATNGKEPDKNKDKDKETNGHKRGKSKTRLDKGKAKDKDKAAKGGDIPDRECIVQ